MVAGGEIARAAVLAVAMLGLQVCIGTLNDVVDEPLDAVAKPWKPIPSGLVDRRLGLVIAASAGGGGLLLAATFGLTVLAMAGAMLACGIVYDLWLKPTPLAWACFSIAFTILPVYAWYGAVGTLPPRPEFLLPLAALAGPALQLSNGLADLEVDRAAGLATLAVRLGRRGGVLVVALLLLTIHALAWLTLPAAAPAAAILVGAATLLASGGLLLSASRPAAWREIGWMIQAGSIALLGLGWLAAVSAAVS